MLTYFLLQELVMGPQLIATVRDGRSLGRGSYGGCGLGSTPTLGRGHRIHISTDLAVLAVPPLISDGT